MRKLLLIVALALITALTFSENLSAQGKNQLNLGVGFSDWGVPLYIGIDHYVSNDVTLGGEFSYRSGYREYYKDQYYDRNVMGFSGNANYHFNTILEIPRTWDLYAGINVGFYVWNKYDTYHGNNNSGLGLGGQIGGRYYLSNKVGLNLEFGGGNAFRGGKVGLTIKI